VHREHHSVSNVHEPIQMFGKADVDDLCKFGLVVNYMCSME